MTVVDNFDDQSVTMIMKMTRAITGIAVKVLSKNHHDRMFFFRKGVPHDRLTSLQHPGDMWGLYPYYMSYSLNSYYPP